MNCKHIYSYIPSIIISQLYCQFSPSTCYLLCYQLALFYHFITFIIPTQFIFIVHLNPLVHHQHNILYIIYKTLHGCSLLSLYIIQHSLSPSLSQYALIQFQSDLSAERYFGTLIHKKTICLGNCPHLGSCSTDQQAILHHIVYTIATLAQCIFLASSSVASYLSSSQPHNTGCNMLVTRLWCTACFLVTWCHSDMCLYTGAFMNTQCINVIFVYTQLYVILVLSFWYFVLYFLCTYCSYLTRQIIFVGGIIQASQPLIPPVFFFWKHKVPPTEYSIIEMHSSKMQAVRSFIATV